MKKRLALMALLILTTIPLFLTGTKQSEAASYPAIGNNEWLNVPEIPATVYITNTNLLAGNKYPGKTRPWEAHCVLRVDFYKINGIDVSNMGISTYIICKDKGAANPAPKADCWAEVDLKNVGGGYYELDLNASDSGYFGSADNINNWCEGSKGYPHTKDGSGHYHWQGFSSSFIATNDDGSWAQWTDLNGNYISDISQYGIDGYNKCYLAIWCGAGDSWLLTGASSSQGDISYVKSQAEYGNDAQGAENGYWASVNNPPTATYTGKSNPYEMIYSNAVTGYDTKINWTQQEIYTYNANKSYLSGPHTCKANYSWGDTYKTSHEIKYKANTPTMIQEKYCPYNLNTNQKADNSVIDSSYANSQPLNMSVNNKHNITDGSAMNTLDLNNDYKFDVQFNNNVFGLPESYNWYEEPPTLANGDWESVNGGSYANGRATSGDSNYRYNTILRGAISGHNSSSLMYNNYEYTNDNPLIKNNKYNLWNGGEFASRFVNTGTYTTTNGNSSSNFKDWWEVTYDEARFYEYGTQYHGLIDVDGVHKPYLDNCGSTTSWDAGGLFPFAWGTGEGLSYESDGNSTRGLYVGSHSKTFEQPVLYGKWNVKTIAGNIQ